MGSIGIPELLVILSVAAVSLLPGVVLLALIDGVVRLAIRHERRASQ